MAFSADEKTQASAFEEHIKRILKQDGIQNYNVKLYKDLNKYITRLEQLIVLENEKAREEDVLSILFSVSL